MPRKKNEEENIEAAAPGAEEAAEETPAEAIEAAPATSEPSAEAEKPKRMRKAAEPKAEDNGSADTAVKADGKKGGKRAEKIGIVASDKMTKTVVVRVDRVVRHPVYRKYVKRRKKFMAHDELGARIGDKVKIIETRPLSARKRWRVVEIIQKAEL